MGVRPISMPQGFGDGDSGGGNVDGGDCDEVKGGDNGGEKSGSGGGDRSRGATLAAFTLAATGALGADGGGEGKGGGGGGGRRGA